METIPKYQDDAPVPGCIVRRYIDLLAAAGYTPICDQDDEDPFNGNHLYWMLMELLHAKPSSRTKMHRWLGFIQAGLVALKLTKVSQERDLTRDVFNGS